MHNFASRPLQSIDPEVYRCKCGSCDHDSRALCIEGRCDCCDLEDTFAILARRDDEPANRMVTRDHIVSHTAA